MSRFKLHVEDAAVRDRQEKRVKLPHQVAAGIRRCIVDGVWKPGDKLPSARALASELGVSFRVAVDALRILAKEGCVSLRAKSCAVVNVEETLLKNHRILLVLSGGIHHFMPMTVYDMIRARLKLGGASRNPCK